MANPKSLTRKQAVNLEYSYKWLSRAQTDLRMFKKLVPCDRDTHKIAHCTDPALSVYLLQQSIEKATKAVAAATGKYPYGKLKSQGHNSLAVLLDFYQRILISVGNNALGTELFSKAFGQNIKEGSVKIQAILTESQKLPQDRKLGERLYREQFAAASANEIDGILDLLLKIRKEGFIGVLSSLFGPHGKIPINGKRLDTNTSENFFNSFLVQAGSRMNLPQLSDSQQEAMLDMVKALAKNGISRDEDKKYVIKRRDFEEQNLGQWSLIALLYLAAFTFPHEATARYPGPRKKSLEPAGCEDYSYNLGIVNRIGRMGYVATLAINELKPELEAISRIVESGIVK
jgi:hypothetical protein